MVISVIMVVRVIMVITELLGLVLFGLLMVIIMDISVIMKRVFFIHFYLTITNNQITHSDIN